MFKVGDKFSTKSGQSAVIINIESDTRILLDVYRPSESKKYVTTLLTKGQLYELIKSRVYNIDWIKMFLDRYIK